MKLLDVAKVIGAVGYTGPNLEFDTISIDSRHRVRAALFIAIVGDHFDGHHFIDAAARQGAIAAIVSTPIATPIPCLVVSDTRAALARLAGHHRSQMSVVMMGVTGSCGKTTTKMLLASILSQHAKTLSSQRSFNNDIGVPLTLLKLDDSYQYAVCEMGASHPNDIARLTHLVKPDVAAITNAAAAHLEGFGDLQGVACAKSEIFQGLPPEGIAVINADDSYSDFWRKQVDAHSVMTFGRYNSADVMAESIELNAQAQPKFRLVLPYGKFRVQLQLMGEHNVMNALTAATMAAAKKIPIKAIKAGLEKSVHPDKRLVTKQGYAGAIVIDDTYNANPSSVLAAISVLAQRGGDSIFVLGDMLELGPHAKDWHRHIGEQAGRAGICHLYCYGEYSRFAAEAFGDNAYHFTEGRDLLSALCDYLHENAIVLVKGSHAMGMDKIVNVLTEK